MKHEGHCHCGAVRFEFDGAAITSALRCTCSLCARRAAWMLNDFIAEKDFTVTSEEDALGLYQFGDGTARHYFCNRCGIYTHHESSRRPGHYRVNLACIDSVDTFQLKYEVFDGKHLL